MKIKLKSNIVFVRKDKTLFQNEWKLVKEQDKTGFVYLDDTQGVSIMPFKYDTAGKTEVLVREEPNPLHGVLLTIIAGKRDDHEVGSLWWQETAQRELGEESGYWVDDKRRFFKLGDVVVGKDYKDKDVFLAVDLTGVKQGEMKPDKGSMIEKKSKNFWVSTDLLKRMVLEQGGNVDSYFLAMASKFLVHMGIITKSEEADLEKAVSSKPSKLKGKEKPGHKYIRREPLPAGGYKYIYEEPKGKKGAAEEPTKQGGILQQLVAALGAKKPAEQKTEKKINPIEAFATVPKEVPDFKKGTSARQWMGIIDKMVGDTVFGEIKKFSDSSSVIDDPASGSVYADYALTLVERASNAYAAQDVHWADMKVENKKLDESAQNAVKKGIMSLSHSLAVINHMTSVLNSSVVEKTLSNMSDKLEYADDEEDSLVAYGKLEKIEALIPSMTKEIVRVGEIVERTNWLKGTDPKIDFMTEKVFESVDEFVKSRNRFVENTFGFYIEKISHKVDNLNDSYSFLTALQLMERLQTFKTDVAHKSYTATETIFANQLSLKQRGVYDGMSRFQASATRKVVDKFRSIADFDSAVSKDVAKKIASSKAFSFMSFVGNPYTPFDIGEQVFSYIEMFGVQKYYQDALLMTNASKDLFATSKHQDAAMEILDKAVKGLDVYNDDDVLYHSTETFHRQLGNTQKPKEHAPEFSSASFYAAMNTMLLTNSNTPIESKTAAFIRTWSHASHGSLASNMIEQFVDSKNIDRGTYVNYHVASNRTVDARRAETKQALQSSIEQIYENTQAQLREEYSEKPHKLYRGNGASEVKSIASSWTISKDTAGRYGKHITEAEVPHEAVLIYNGSKTEDYWTFEKEKEFVVVPGLMSPDRKIEMISKDMSEEYGENY